MLYSYPGEQPWDMVSSYFGDSCGMVFRRDEHGLGGDKQAYDPSGELGLDPSDELGEVIFNYISIRGNLSSFFIPLAIE